MRGFNVAKGYGHLDISLPKRGSGRSAGYDLAVCRDIRIEPGEIVLADTGVKAYMQDDEVLKVYPRSSLPHKHGLTIPNNVGIIDADYYDNPDNDGAIFVQLRNFTHQAVHLKKGTRIAQGIFCKYLKADGDAVINDTRNGGFGSTG